MAEPTIKLIIIGLIAGFAFIGGWSVEGWRKDAEIADLNSTVQADKARAAHDSLYRIAAANRRADAAMLQMAGWEQTLTAFAQEKNDELARLTTGRRCLDSAAVRVLNRPAPQLTGSVSQATGLVLRADATAAAAADDGAFATDADVAGWIGLCQRSFATCRNRLQLIADFYAGEPSPSAQTEAGDSAQLCADCGNQTEIGN